MTSSTTSDVINILLQLLKKKEFQAAVVEAAKVAIKPSYENREISKAQYKDIMKKAVNKVGACLARFKVLMWLLGLSG